MGPITATNQGAARFNGKRWRFFTTDDGIPDNNVTSIDIAQDGTVWIGTEGGVGRFTYPAGGTGDGIAWQRYTREDGLPDNHITAVRVGPSDIVWASTHSGTLLNRTGVYSGTLSWLDGNIWHIVETWPHRSGEQVNTTLRLATVDKKGRPWLSAGLYGMWYLEDQAWVRVPQTLIDIRHALDDSRWAVYWGTIWHAGKRNWITTGTSVAVCHWLTSGAIYCYAVAPPHYGNKPPAWEEPWRMVSIRIPEAKIFNPAALARRGISALDIAPDGTAWMATREYIYENYYQQVIINRNLLSFDGQSWCSYDLAQSDFLSQIEIAPDGSVWAITSQSGRTTSGSPIVVERGVKNLHPDKQVGVCSPTQ